MSTLATKTLSDQAIEILESLTSTPQKLEALSIILQTIKSSGEYKGRIPIQGWSGIIGHIILSEEPSEADIQDAFLELRNVNPLNARPVGSLNAKMQAHDEEGVRSFLPN